MTANPTPVSGIVLAAGASTRLDGPTPKQLLLLDGTPLVARVVRAALASRLSEVVVVVGHAAADVSRALAAFDVHIVENPDYRTGQSSSVRAGLGRISPGSRGALFLLADQPLLSSCLIDDLLMTYRNSGGPIVVPTYAGDRRAPALFDRGLFAELERITGDTGGRSVMARHARQVLELPVDDPLELADVDTASDLERLAREAGLAAG